MKSIISIAIVGDYPSDPAPDALIRGLRTEMIAHARAYGLTDIDVAVNTWKADLSMNRAMTWERPA